MEHNIIFKNNNINKVLAGEKVQVVDSHGSQRTSCIRPFNPR